MTSEPMTKIAAAILKVQAEIRKIGGPKKKSTLNVIKEGKVIFSTKYADLGEVWASIHSSLTQNEIAVIQSPQFRDGVFLLRTTLLHSSGESISGEYLIRPVKEAPQEYGSAVTFARRYSLCAMLGIVTEDDDGARGSGYGKKPAAIEKVRGGGDKVSATDRIALKKAWTANGWTDADAAAYLAENFEINTTSEITKDQYPGILTAFSNKKPSK